MSSVESRGQAPLSSPAPSSGDGNEGISAGASHSYTIPSSVACAVGVSSCAPGDHGSETKEPRPAGNPGGMEALRASTRNVNCDSGTWRKRSTDGSNTKGTRAHTQKELIRGKA